MPERVKMRKILFIAPNRESVEVAADALGIERPEYVLSAHQLQGLDAKRVTFVIVGTGRSPLKEQGAEIREQVTFLRDQGAMAAYIYA